MNSNINYKTIKLKKSDYPIYYAIPAEKGFLSSLRFATAFDMVTTSENEVSCYLQFTNGLQDYDRLNKIDHNLIHCMYTIFTNQNKDSRLFYQAKDYEYYQLNISRLYQSCGHHTSLKRKERRAEFLLSIQKLIFVSGVIVNKQQKNLYPLIKIIDVDKDGKEFTVSFPYFEKLNEVKKNRLHVYLFRPNPRSHIQCKDEFAESAKIIIQLFKLAGRNRCPHIKVETLLSRNAIFVARINNINDKTRMRLINQIVSRHLAGVWKAIMDHTLLVETYPDLKINGSRDWPQAIGLGDIIDFTYDKENYRSESEAMKIGITKYTVPVEKEQLNQTELKQLKVWEKSVTLENPIHGFTAVVDNDIETDEFPRNSIIDEEYQGCQNSTEDPARQRAKFDLQKELSSINLGIDEIRGIQRNILKSARDESATYESCIH